MTLLLLQEEQISEAKQIIAKQNKPKCFIQKFKDNASGLV